MSTASAVPTTRRAVASALRQLRADGRSLQPRALKLRHAALWRAIECHFPSHERALAAVGIKSTECSGAQYVLWDRDRIVQRLRELRAERKELNIGAIQKYEPRLGGAIFRYFRYHDAALIAAGIDPASVRLAHWWTKQMVLDELHRRHGQREDLSSKHLCYHAPPLFAAMIREFGSFAKALRAADIDPEQVRRPRLPVWPTPKIISGIREFYARWWKKHARTEPPCPRLSGALPDLASAARNRFGSTGAALKAAGIEDPTYHPRHQWTKRQVLGQIRKLQKSGAELSYKAIAVFDVRLIRAAERYFGSLGDAVRAAGFSYVRHPRSDRSELRHWTEDSVLRILRELHADGQDLRHRQMQEKRQPLFWAAKELFGSYANAVRAAGIDYWKMSRVQLAKQRRRARKNRSR